MRTPHLSLVRGALISIAMMMLTAGHALADESARRGVSMVSSVDLVRSRMIVDDEEYRVDENCRIQRYNGVVATLDEIRVPVRNPGELIATSEVDYIRFEAVRRRSGWFMEQITILEEPVK